MGSKTAGSVDALRQDLRAAATPERAAATRRFFKTGKGQYGEGDVFLGVAVPQIRKAVRAHRGIPLHEMEELLQSEIHEERLAALLLMVDGFGRAKRDPESRGEIFRRYLARLSCVNNWDLVDSSAPYIVGAWLADKDRSLLDSLAISPHLWTRRVAIVSTLHFIRNGEGSDALRIARTLLDDEHDLIHKATGWMLREVGLHVGMEELRGFLARHAARMPRTMLRYSIEKMPRPERRHWMEKR
jgi:3-methyladenine DNA glycosylase AlkD